MYQSPLHPTLYTPATTAPHKLIELANHDVKGQGIWRLVICTEDSILSEDLPQALCNLELVLELMDSTSPICVFVRVRSPEVLARVLDMQHVEKLAGFVVPKADPTEFPLYAEQIIGTKFVLMPILESPLMTDRHYRETLRTVLMDQRYAGVIDCLRIGANDLMGYLGIRRDTAEFTVYETPVGVTIHEIINEFRGMGGFVVTAPVFECMSPKYDDLFRKEVRQHIMNGLYGQTVIHPRHLRPIRDMYKVSEQDLQSAQGILSRTDAVKGVNGRMDEYTTHWRWAKTIVERHQLFGVNTRSATLLDRIH